MKKQKKLNKTKIIFIVGPIVLIMLDQILKIVLGTKENTGDDKFTYMAMALLALAITVKFLTTQNKFVDLKTKIFLSLIITGGVSNIIDQVFRGEVINYINIGNILHINLAHIYILIGWICMAAIFAHFSSKELKSKKGE